MWEGSEWGPAVSVQPAGQAADAKNGERANRLLSHNRRKSAFRLSFGRLGWVLMWPFSRWSRRWVDPGLVGLAGASGGPCGGIFDQSSACDG